MCEAGLGDTGAADVGAADVAAGEAGVPGLGASARESGGAISVAARSNAAMVLAFDLVTSPPWMIGALRPGQGDAPGVIIWVGATSAPFTMIVAWCVSIGPHARAVKK